ncbi:hypothetical protein BGX31_009240 [Mortierella sp. GBA43]|nr:hypothetical protein BGX31_009240 [Mortierella sp. GBA43]
MHQNKASDSSREEDGRALRKFFEPLAHWAPGTAIRVEGSDEAQAVPAGQGVVIPDATPNFKVLANFRSLKAGHYTVTWRLKALDNISLPNGLRFSANIIYDDEPSSTVLCTVLQQEELAKLVKHRQYDVVLGESVVVQPHTNWANVELSMTNNESMDDLVHSGIEIIHAELKPFNLEPRFAANENMIVVKQWSRPKYTLDYTRSHTFESDPSSTPSAFPITRLAWSKEGMFLAALALSPNGAYVTVWDMDHIGDPASPPQDMSSLYQHSASGFVEHQDIDTLPIGLAISTDGGQVAIYQEPKIGEWQDDSSLPQSTFQFQLFSNLLVPQPSVTVDMNEESNESDEPVAVASRSRSDGILKETEALTGRTLLQRLDCPHERLLSFIGYSAFLPCRGGANQRNLERKGNHDNDQSQHSCTTLFAACDGINITIYRTSPEGGWECIRQSPLAGLIPALSRRIGCKMMMESISSCHFMWLEDQGRCCSVWKLENDANVSYIFNAEGSTFQRSTFQDSMKMALSPDASIAAIAGDNGSLTTYYTGSGVVITKRHFPGCTFEYIGFNGNNGQLYTVTRDSYMELKCRTMDPLLLTNESIEPEVHPVPTIGTTISTFFRGQKLKGQRIIFQASGSRINSYVSYLPNPTDTISSEKVEKADPTIMTHKSLLDPDIQYQLRINRALITGGDGGSQCVLQIEIVEENLAKTTQNVIFSFAPEPWVQVTGRHSDTTANLLSTFFLPCGTRFATVGLQTVQIWSLPNADNLNCNLQSIWSQPIAKQDLQPDCEHTKDYYHLLKSASVFMDVESGSTIAEIEMKGGSAAMIVHLPGVGTVDAHFAVLHCFRSIHLLAAAYKLSQNKDAFKDYVDAIIQFVRKYINHKVPLDVVFPPTDVLDLEWNEPSESCKSTPSDLATILRLLLDQPYNQDMGSLLVERLFDTSDSFWIPNDIPSLNPIKYVIAAKNKRLLDVLIEYCTRNAKLLHPVYVNPIVPHLGELLDQHPNDVKDIVRKMSYIPAPNQDYILSHGIGADHRDWLYTNLSSRYFESSRNLDTRKNPVFTLRQRLQWVPTNGRFPSRTNLILHPPPYKNSIYKIYVSPFLLFNDKSEKGRSIASTFSELVKKESIPNPTLLASLDYKWYKVGMEAISPRIVWVVMYYLVVVFITRRELRTDRWGFDRIMGAYEDGGVVLIFSAGSLYLEWLKMAISPRDYFSSPFSYIDLVACVLPVIGAFMTIGEGARIWTMGFGILCLYLKMFFELRIFREFGIASSIIVNIARRIKWYILILGFILFGFTHVLIYTLHSVRVFQDCEDNSMTCTSPEGPDRVGDYPKEFFPALSASYFFLSGRYDPVSDLLTSGPGAFRVLMAIFYFFMVVLLFNILIAVMNDAFNESAKEGRNTQLRLVSEILHSSEKFYRLKENPRYIYYGATDEEVMQFREQCAEQDTPIFASESSQTGDNPKNMHIQQASHGHDMDHMKDLVRQNHDETKHELAELRGLVKTLLTELNAARGQYP